MDIILLNQSRHISALKRAYIYVLYVYKIRDVTAALLKKIAGETVVNADAHGRLYFHVITPHAALIVSDRFHDNPSMTRAGKPLNMHSSGSIKSSP